MQKVKLAKSLKRNSLHLRTPAGKRRAVISLLHVLHHVVPGSGEHFGRLAGEINLGHGEVHLRLLSPLVHACEQTPGRSLVPSFEAPLLSIQLVLNVKNALTLKQPVSVLHVV